MVRWTGLPLVVLILGPLACSTGNPGWTLNASGSESASDGTGETTSITTTTTTTTSTSVETTTTTDATTTTTTTGVVPVCPATNYCPFYTDVAAEPDQASCEANGGVDRYLAFIKRGDGNMIGDEFYACPQDTECTEANCTALKLSLPPVYGLFTQNLQDCNTIEHEKVFAGGKCLTRSLSLWNGSDDPMTAAPRIILAAHSPEAPPALADLTIAAGEETSCPCTIPTGCAADYVLNPASWCCGGEVTIRGLTLTNDVGQTYNLEYTGFLGVESGIEYRGCKYDFLITQTHFDLGDDCQMTRAYQPGWFMQRGSCQ